MQTATIQLLPKQTEAWEYFESPDVIELGYGGAAGGGKSRLGCYIGITIAEKYPKSRGAIARKELKTLRLTTLTELFAIFNELGYSKNDYTYNAQDSIVRFANGSEILLLDTAYSPQDPEYTRFGSLNLTWAWVEESNETPEKAKNILKTRIGRNNKFNGEEVKPFWLETFNPNKGHVYRDYFKPWKEGSLPYYRKFVKALPGDNKHLPQAYIENLKRADKTTKERLLMGNFDYDDDPNRIMAYEAILDLKTNTLTENKQKYLINDIARFGGDKIILGEFEGMTLIGLTVDTFQDIETTRDKIHNLAIEHQIPYSQILSDENGVGGGVVDGLKGTKGFMGGSRPLEVFDTLIGKMTAEGFINLRSQCYFKLAEEVNQHHMAIKLRYFNSNIEGYTLEMALGEIEEELDAIKMAENTGQGLKLAIIPKAEIKEALGRSPDFADILSMRMLFELKKPVVVAYQVMHSQKPKNPAR